MTESPGSRTGSEQPVPPTAPVLDADVLAQFESMSPGFSAELIALFQRDVPARLELLRVAVAVGDWTAVSRVAHTLKGSSGNLGAKALAQACAALNVSAGVADGPRVVELAREVEEAWKDVQAAFASPDLGG